MQLVGTFRHQPTNARKGWSAKDGDGDIWMRHVIGSFFHRLCCSWHVCRFAAPSSTTREAFTSLICHHCDNTHRPTKPEESLTEWYTRSLWYNVIDINKTRALHFIGLLISYTDFSVAIMARLSMPKYSCNPPLAPGFGRDGRQWASDVSVW